MYQLVAIGDITVDMYFHGDSIKEEKGRFELAVGGKYYADMFHCSLGGSAANITIHASALGLDTAAVATVGENSFKNLIVQTLSKKTVSTEFLHFAREHTSISTILLSSSGERTVIKYSDPHEHISLSEHALDRIRRSKIICMGNLADVPIKERVTFLKAIRTVENTIALNFGAQECEKGIDTLADFFSCIDILILNKYEIATLLKKDPQKIDLTKSLLSQFKGSVKMLLITDGAQGSYVHTADQVFHQEASAVTKIVDTTGAGDSFTAAFLAKYTDSQDIQAALKSASDYAAKQLADVGAN